MPRGEAPSEANHAVNKLWWAIIENARTFFERNACGVSQNPKPLGRGGKERG